MRLVMLIFQTSMLQPESPHPAKVTPSDPTFILRES